MSSPAVHAAKAGRRESLNRVTTTQANTALTADATIAAISSTPSQVHNSEHRFASVDESTLLSAQTGVVQTARRFDSYPLWRVDKHTTCSPVLESFMILTKRLLPIFGVVGIAALSACGTSSGPSASGGGGGSLASCQGTIPVATDPPPTHHEETKE